MSCGCCYPSRIIFDTDGKSICKDFFAYPPSDKTECQTTICNDGKSYYTVGTCGYGMCDISGCNCENCIGGHDADALEAFRNKHGSRVSNVRRN